jgi:hypothetical protein
MSTSGSGRFTTGKNFPVSISKAVGPRTCLAAAETKYFSYLSLESNSSPWPRQYIDDTFQRETYSTFQLAKEMAVRQKYDPPSPHSYKRPLIPTKSNVSCHPTRNSVMVKTSVSIKHAQEGFRYLF